MQIDVAIEMENMIKKINQSERRTLCNNNLERMIKSKQTELENTKIKKSVYEDWKLGDISKEEYFEYKNSYEKNIQSIEQNIKYLEQETENTKTKF